MKKISALFISLSFLCAPAIAAEQVYSPTKKVKVEFFLTDAGQAAYRTYFNDKVVVNDSLLGFKFNDGSALAGGLTEFSAKQSAFNKTWEQPWGEERFIKNNYSQLSVALQEFSGLKRKINIVFRVYDDGVGFRYEFPKQEHLSTFEITDELTQFNLADDGAAWWTPALAGEQYEYLYRNTRVSKMGLVHTPVTIKTPSGLYLSLHEAALHNYSAMNLQSAADGGKITASLVPLTKQTNVKVKLTTPAVTPWRTLEIGHTPGDLVT